MQWNMMSIECAMSLASIMNSLGEGPLSIGVKEALRLELEENEEKGGISNADCYAAADHIFARGIWSSLRNIKIQAVNITFDFEKIPYRGMVEHFFDYATQGSSVEAQWADACGAAIQCAVYLTDADFSPKHFPSSWKCLLGTQRALGAFFGLNLPGDTLLPETRRLMYVYRESIHLCSNHLGLWEILCVISQISVKPSRNECFIASPGKYKVIGTKAGRECVVLGGDFSLEEAIRLSSMKETEFIAKEVFNDEGLWVW
ncbi:MAG: hypothetical protein WCO05_02290 [Candidatus Moraniibacteriota bacterium]|jgi:hypothetical protein